MAEGKTPTREELAMSGYRLPARMFEKAEAGAPANKAARTTSTRETTKADALEGVDFASPAAKKAARDAGLTAENFKRRRKTSDGGFNKDDVERIAASVGAQDEDDNATDGAAASTTTEGAATTSGTTDAQE